MRSEDSLWILLALCVSAPVPTASACSVGPDYRMPSHFELVKEADAILLAEAVDFFPARQDGELRDVVRFKVIRVLKGALCPRFVDVAGFLDFMGRTEEGDLYSVRRGALAGSCIAYDYRLGKNYVLFGTPYETRFAVSGPPFSRVNEEVDGPESPWTQAVSRYAEVAAIGDPEEEHEALKKLLEAANKHAAPGRIPPALSIDIIRYLSFPSCCMPWPDLLEMYRSSQSAKERAQVIEAMSGCDYGPYLEEVKQFLHEVVEKQDWEVSLVPIALMVARTKESACLKRLLPLYSGQEEVARAICLAADELTLPAVFDRVRVLPPMAAALIAPIFESSQSTDILEWKAGIVRRLRDEIGADYSENWRATVALASLGDPAIVSWAIADIREGKGAGCCGLSYHIVARSPLPEAHRFVEELLLEKRYENLSRFAYAYRESLRPLPWPLLKEMVLLAPKPRALSSELRDLLQPLARDGETRAGEFLDLLVQADAHFASADLTDKTLEHPLQKRLTLLACILGVLIAIVGCVFVSIRHSRRIHLSRGGGQQTALELPQDPGA